ncbi:EAL domain-containing protein [Herbaspirillum sp. YR522]|uniref:sensor domain-containing protein n=1 Tax=Herbaspirillum sp. YR522 TaxID=1144342 RepID=UPI00026F6E33|nr:EAL domain-containing protein [Herbaspirillum sp. YR522]EJM98612.1 PAS domain S-box/diguanylate cyclase (GGDEF) domain-containing protein [Herbaspirillum sp. YR522]
MHENEPFITELNRRQSGDERSALLAALSRSMAMLEFAADGTLLEVNDNFLRLLGYERHELVGQHHRVLCDATYVTTDQYQDFWRHLQRGEVISGTLQRIRSDGTTVWLEAICSPMLDDRGRLLKVISVAADITAHIDDSQQTHSVLNALNRSLGVVEFTADGVILGANSNYLKTMQYLAPELVGQPHSLLCHDDYASSAEYAAFWRDVCCGRFFSGRFQRRARNGHTVWWEATYSPVLDAHGQPLKVICIGADVTYRVTREAKDREHLHLLSLGINETDNAVIITDDQNRIVFHNIGFTRMLGFQAQDAVGKKPHELFANHPSFVRSIEACHGELLAGRSYHTEELIHDMHDQPLWMSAVVNPILDSEGKLINAVCVMTDITNTKVHEVLQYKVLNAMARDSSLAEQMNLLCEEVERVAPDVLASIQRVDEQGRLYTLAGPSLPESFNRAIEGLQMGPLAGSCGAAAFTGEQVVADAIDSDPRWAAHRELALHNGLRACWSTPIKTADGRVIGTFAFYYRMPRFPSTFHRLLVDAGLHLCALAIEREASRAKIHQLAFYDALTGLPNRALLLVQAGQAIAAAERSHSTVAVLFVDLDRFKQVNDSLGHQAGDELLRTIASRLQAQARRSDIVGRLSGDEFVVVLNQYDANHLTDVVKRIQEHLCEPCHINGTPLDPSASIGVAMFPANGSDIETLLHRADMAMYQAKAVNRGRFSFFSDEMNSMAQERLALEGALRDALRGGDFVLHYQPQIHLGHGGLHGVEALARWPHPQLGQISPGRFIPIAEECGLIGELGKWALEEACFQLSDWRRRGIQVPSVSVNLSATNFHDLELPQFMAELLQRYALLPSDLCIEITETVLMDTNPSTNQTIAAVHDMGVPLAMDDFGTGYSSLGYLRKLPVGELKLDQSFVRDMVKDETVSALTNAVIRIGESLKLTVVAEGVEELEQCRLLQQQGCDVAQGYYFSRPLTAEALEEWLRDFSHHPIADGIAE